MPTISDFPVDTETTRKNIRHAANENVFQLILMSFGGLLGSLYGDLPAPKVAPSGTNEETAGIPVASRPEPPQSSPIILSQPPSEQKHQSSSPIVQTVNEEKPLGWTTDKARLLFLQPTTRKRDIARKLNSAATSLPQAKRVKDLPGVQGKL